MKNKYYMRGFTLLELLVVVLIIGILAAVALPQYQKAVVKSRFAEALTNLKTMAVATQVCYLETGEECESDELAVSFDNSNGTQNFDYMPFLAGSDDALWAKAGYTKENVCLCYMRSGEIVIHQGERCVNLPAASMDYAKLLKLREVEETECCCCYS